VRDRVTLVDGNAQQVMAASDVILLASGTATLEATLVGRPMVVAYRLSLLTTFLLKTLKLFKAPFFAQPNLLAGRQVVPEYFNDEVRADVLGPPCSRNWGVPIAISSCKLSPPSTRRCGRDASARAAEAIVECCGQGSDEFGTAGVQSGS
jgi:lipid-A-disaccharide synthase